MLIAGKRNRVENRGLTLPEQFHYRWHVDSTPPFPLLRFRPPPFPRRYPWILWMADKWAAVNRNVINERWHFSKVSIGLCPRGARQGLSFASTRQIGRIILSVLSGRLVENESSLKGSGERGREESSLHDCWKPFRRDRWPHARAHTYP